MPQPANEPLSRPVGRPCSSPPLGLTDEQAAERAAAGLANTAPPSLGKTTGEILRDNLLTFYNLVFVLLAGCLCAVGAFRDILFLGVVVCNAGIGIFQELRVRAVLQKAAVLQQSPVETLRGGRKRLLEPEQLVQDDVVIFSAGGQICADAVLLAGAVEVNEALLTGEADPVQKHTGDKLLSGSYVTAGECTARLERVGEQSCAARLTQAARLQKRRRAGLVRDLDRWLRAVGAVLVPFGVLMGLHQCALPDTGLRYAVSSTVAALCGMIPEGLYLLVSVALAAGTLRLARQRTLVHEMACIENLARVDLLCLDKTGTLTEGSLQVEKLLPAPDAAEQAQSAASGAACGQEPPAAFRAEVLPGPEGLPAQSALTEQKKARLAALLGGFARSAAAPNATIRALLQSFEGPALACTEEVPFSSERKWSAQFVPDAPAGENGRAEPAAVSGQGAAAGQNTPAGGSGALVHTDASAGLDAAQNAPAGRQNGMWYLLGAPERLAPGQNAALLAPYLAAGRRVLAFAAGQNAVRGGALTGRHTLLGYIVLADTLRPAARETLRYFRRQGVTVKVLSGDAPAAVGRIAQMAGLPGAEKTLDMSALSPQDPAGWAALAREYTVFGRVSPEQKRQLIAAMRAARHTVAMLGDGVNDLPALKEADCSIAMAAGSEAARQASQIVLLDSDFAALPKILCEGRRVINNIGRSASLFLVKNIFSFITAAALLFSPLAYPLIPIQVTLISALLIGAPSFLLTFEAGFARPKGRFLPLAVSNALPGGLCAAAALLFVSWLGGRLGLGMGQVSSICTLLLGINGLCALLLLCRPLTRLRAAVIGLMALGFFGAVSFLPGFFGIEPLCGQSRQIVCGVGTAIPAVQCVLVWAIWLCKTRLERRAHPR